MSLILKGIDMPKEGEHIVAVIKNNGKYSYWKQDTEYGICEPMQTAEAIQIPTPHGRLIDGDEFKSWVDDWYDCTDIGNIVESWIDERPTILEAEE